MSSLHDDIFDELVSQIQNRRMMATDRKLDYYSDDPVNSLPLTEYQRGLIDGRLETWEFLDKLSVELKLLYAKKEAAKNENIQAIN
ncbi:MAG: hypothetical protein PHG42_08235 [Bacteroides sp.]|nr:hypothetical protein [Fermentimonas sp.]MDD4055760.1 hypothetical protein [Bacteroides sp.]MDD4804315.1 hypothetical protein [Candidatus Paceibacterota bacterium]